MEFQPNSSTKKSRFNVWVILGLAAVFIGVIAALVLTGLLVAKIAKNGNNHSSNYVKPPIVTDGPAPPLGGAWFKKSPIYQIYPRSFKDSNGDGTGDLKGIISKLDYLKNLGIKNVWISPIYKSPMKDFGYDISNFTMIDPLFGTMADFDDLVAAMHIRAPSGDGAGELGLGLSNRLGMKCIMDFVPNHSSDLHPWFQKSLKGVLPYKIIMFGKMSKMAQRQTIGDFGNSSWQYSAGRGQYYLHQYLIQQPDMNYRNPRVQQEMLNVLKFWINHNVDGFRIDAIIHLVEDAQFRDNPSNPNWHGSPYDYDAQIHKYNINQQLTYNITANWVKLFKQMGYQLGKHIFSVVEATTNLNYTMKYYSSGVDFPFNFNLAKLDSSKNAAFIKQAVDYWITSTPPGGWPNWVLGSHDVHRVATRMGGTMYTDVANMLLLLLPGTPVCYYGDEIGMTDVFVPYNQTKDPAGKKWDPILYINKTRDPERTPMQWTPGPYAGFSSSTNGTWLPISKNYTAINVQFEMQKQWSHVNVFKKLLALRQKPAFVSSGTNIQTFTDQTTQDVFMFTRRVAVSKSYMIFINVGHSKRLTSVKNLSQMIQTTSTSATVEMKTGNVPQFQIGQNIPIQNGVVSLFDGQGLVISFY